MNLGMGEKEKVWVDISHASWIGSLKKQKIVLDKTELYWT